MSEDVIIAREGAVGRITLNRPKALNALTFDMVRQLWGALVDWRGDHRVAAIVLDGAGGRGLCAGGDVRGLYDSAKDGVGFAAQFWRDEYRLNSLIHRYPKPFVAIMDGIVMGGGIGLSAHARHRIVTEKSQLAMPETTIGLIPDVGGTWLLSRLRPGLGAYIGLSGYRMNGSDAIQAGFAQSYIPTEAIASFIRALCEPGDRSVDDIIEAFETPVPLSPLMADAEKIETWFGGDRMELILERLSETTDPMAQRITVDLAARSPLALKATLAALRRARSLRTLEEALTIEYRLCTALFHRGEFIEGVRALLVDKDKAPRWNPPTLAEVGDDLVAGLFARSGLVEDFELVPQTGA